MLVGLATCLCSCAPGQVEKPLSAPPQRVVSLVPSATEMIHAVGAVDRIVGVTLNDNYPSEVANLPKVGDQTIDLERLVSLKPDLVVLDAGFNQNRDALDRLGLSILELRCERLHDVAPALETLGRALGAEQRAREEALAFRTALDQVPKLEREETVFVEIWGEPLMTAGAETLINDVLLLLGLRNSYHDVTGHFQVDPEDVLSRGPGIIILPTVPGTQANSKAAALLREIGREPILIRIDPDLLVRPGPRLLQGVQQLRNILGESD